MKVLVTGSSGFAGGAILAMLREHGVDATGLSRKPLRQVDSDERASGTSQIDTLQADLLDPSSLAGIAERLREFTHVVHAASLKPGKGSRDYSMNVEMTRNLIESLDARNICMILLSSVDVYGDVALVGRVDANHPPNPCNEYGESKLRVEEEVRKGRFRSFHILRVAPVYDGTHLENVRKRLFLPGGRVLLDLIPPPRYSLCRLETLLKRVLDLVRGEGSSGSDPHGNQNGVENVSDPPLSRRELYSLFRAPVFPFPVGLLRPLYHLLRILPGRHLRSLRCQAGKVLYSTDFR